MSIRTLLSPLRSHEPMAADLLDRRPDSRQQAAPPLAATIERIALGDSAAFAELYDATATTLFTVLIRRVGEPALAEPLLQETFLNIWRQAPRFHEREQATTWLLHQMPSIAPDISPSPTR